MINDTTIINSATLTPSDQAFFAIQCVISSYPQDPVRTSIRGDIVGIQNSSDPEAVASHVRSIVQSLNANKSLIEYMVWDYSLVADVANKEFREWVSGIREVRNEKPHESDDVAFQEDCTVYCVVTLAIRSRHESLRNWLEYFPEHVEAADFFTRKTLNSLLDRFASNDSVIITRSTEVLAEMMPADDERFYSAQQLREDSEWSYVHPVY